MLIVDILQFVPEKRLSIEQIEGNSWVGACQNLGVYEAGGNFGKVKG